MMLRFIFICIFMACHCNYIEILFCVFSYATSAFLFEVIGMGQKLLIVKESVVFRKKRSEMHKRFLLNHVRLEITWKHLAWMSINMR